MRLEAIEMQKKPNKTDAGKGSYGICRVIDASRSPSPDSRRSTEMRTLLIAFVLATCGMSQAADSDVTLTLGKPTPDKEVKGLLEYPAKIANNGKKSVWVYSVGGVSTWLYYGASTRSKPTDKWKSLPYEMCGLGAQAVELKPGSSFSFTTVAPAEDAGLEYRVEVTVVTALGEDSGSIEVKSPAVVIPKVEQGGADQPATAPESKPKRDPEPKPESEVRPE
jgi:hypothetical protein